MMHTPLFSKFTNQYSLSKTLRFELKPNPHTKEHLQSSGILKTDKERDLNYVAIKPLFDKLHDRFIYESLSDVEGIDWEDFIVTYNAFRAKLRAGSLEEKDKKSFQKDLDDRMNKLRKQIASQFDKTADLWKKNPERQKTKKDQLEPILKAKGYKILTERNILEVLEIIYAEDPEKLKIIQSFKGFFSYFVGFNQNRENYYSADPKSTAVAHRIVDQNLLTFAVNCTFKELIEKIPTITTEELNIFNPEHYNNCLHQEGIDTYNQIIGGKIDENGKRTIDGINVKINLYNQQYQKTEGFKKVPQLKQLYKQIGSIKAKTIPFTLIENDSELKETLDTLIIEADNRHKTMQNLLDKLWNDTQVDYNAIWISKTALNILSNRYFSSWYLLQEMAVEHKIFSYRKNAEDPYQIPAYISLGQLKELLQKITIDEVGNKEQQQFLFKKYLEIDDEGNSLRNGIIDNREYFKIILQREFDALLHRDEIVVDQEDQSNSYHFLGYKIAREKYKTLGTLDKQNQEHKNIIKQLADSALSTLRFIKTFHINQSKLDGQEFDQDRYAQYDELVEDYPLHNWYDAIRNYMTKKTFSEEKMKLNFESPTLLAGRDKNKESQNLSVLLRNNGKYYLVVMKKDNNRFFERNEELYIADEQGREKMEYKLLPGPNKMLPKCLMPGKDRKKYGASDEVLRLYSKGEFKKGDNFNKKSLETLIDFYKSGLKKYTDRQVFDFDFKPTESYEDISKFYADVEKQGYKLSWTDINEEALLAGVEDGSIYLFQISSKDFSGKSRTPDLQTLYWISLFEENTNVKLNGEAEIFWRNKSMAKKKKQLKTNKFDVYKKNRYTEDKILFHVPITLGFGNKGGFKFNADFNENIILPHHQDMHLIGIDRGEKHLAFYSVISIKTGKIVEQGTLNIVGPKGNEVDYEKKLSEKASTRLAARKNWDIIGNIKNLKEGYISQVVKKITDLMLKYNAIVVFEDLNSGFKKSRKKIEQSVYQNLELALAKKLNFLANKHIPNGLEGSVTNAYQLTPPIKTFGDIKGKQRGAILYTRANYTSQTDPVTGWRKTVYLKRGSIENMRSQLIKHFNIFAYDEKKKAYILSYGNWNLYSNVERWRGAKDKASGKWVSKKYDPTQLLHNWCEKYQVSNKNILAYISNTETRFSTEMLTSLFWIIDLIMQIRNTDDSGNDLILSPVETGGIKFDSREYFNQLEGKEITNNIALPTSGDANGAYNIARKGLMMIERILENPERPNLFVRDAEWDQWLSEQNKLS